MRRYVSVCVAAAFLASACAGDLGADQGLPRCGLQPSTPAGFEFSNREEVEEDDHIGYREEYTGLGGERMVFDYGISTDAAMGLPRGERLPLATLGAGRIYGEGRTWAFVWTAEFPCERMSAVATGLDKQGFLGALGSAGVIPYEEEGEALPGPGGEVGVEVEEELEGEIEGALPPGGPSVEFVAVFATAADPKEIRRDLALLEDAAGDNVWVGAVGCWRGLAPQLGVSKDRWAAAVVALTGNELDFFLRRIESGPIFYGRLQRTAACRQEG